MARELLLWYLFLPQALRGFVSEELLLPVTASGCLWNWITGGKSPSWGLVLDGVSLWEEKMIFWQG